MDDLIAFLNARLDEDEQRAKGSPTEGRIWPRALREVEAKRALLKLSDEATELDRPYLSDRILRISAAVYSGHPDYRPEWKP